MVKKIVVAVSIVLFISILILVQPAVSKEVRLPRGTQVTLKLPKDIDSITNINAPLALEVDRDVVIDGAVVIKSGTPAMGGASMVEHPVQISVESSETVDRQNVGLMISGEPIGTRVDAHTTEDIRVNLPAVSKEVRLPRGTLVTLKLPNGIDSITNINTPLALEVERDVVIDGAVVIKSGTPATGRASMVEGFGRSDKEDNIQISVESSETVDRQNVGLMISGEPIGTRVDAHTTEDIRVNLPAVSKEVRLPRGTLVTLKLPNDVDSITNTNAPLALEVDRDVVIDGAVVIKSGTPAMGRASMVERPLQINVRSTKTVDRQNVGLMMRGEPRGIRVDTYTTRDILVYVP